MQPQPFSAIKKVHGAKELLDIAFYNASKVSVSFSSQDTPLEKAKKREEARVRAASKILESRLMKVVKSFPSLENLHPFYREMCDVLVGNQTLKMYLASLEGAAGVIRRIASEAISKIRRSQTPRDAAKARIEAYGRMTSMVKKLDDRLAFLERARINLAKMPSINPEEPTIVVAGYPNTGKSTIVRAASTAKPEIAEYPFTTKTVILGHFNVGDERFQIMDTPGILDRPMSERNFIEKQAITAIKHLAQAVIFVVDPTPSCGYSLEEQASLLEEVKKLMPGGVPIVTVINKVDLASQENLLLAKGMFKDAIEVIAIEGVGIKETIEKVVKAIRAGRKNTASA
ncbi:MAG: GTPase [Candidatus Jordarchaeales archaeon]|nr:50S ribosome-binding GTPase [Candidatus Jordarchaeia archaeon]